MKFDTIIIGGGICGLVCGIRLLKSGQKVAIVSQGQSALHFCAGSLSLFGKKDGKEVKHPLDAMVNLPENHPYAKLGIDNIKRLLPEVKPMFAEAGITLSGSAEQNHYRITPIGMFKPGWLSMLDYATVPDTENIQWGKVLIVTITGYNDFYPEFIARGLSEKEVDSEIREFTFPEFERLRTSSTEMRATNIARFIKGDLLERVARKINEFIAETKADTVLMPAVVGLFEEEPVKLLQEALTRPLRYVSTMPMSVGGMRAQLRLRDHFQHLGGAYLIGDTVEHGRFDGNRLTEIRTANLGDMALEADNFVLATGSFFSYGIKANPQKIYEPTLHLDVHTGTQEHSQWCDIDLYKEQRYMEFGVQTDSKFHVYKEGKLIENVYAAGSVLGGHNALKESSGGGVAILTGMQVADYIKG